MTFTVTVSLEDRPEPLRVHLFRPSQVRRFLALAPGEPMCVVSNGEYVDIRRGNRPDLATGYVIGPADDHAAEALPWNTPEALAPLTPAIREVIREHRDAFHRRHGIR